MSIKLVYNPFFFQSLRLSKHILGSKYFTNSNTVFILFLDISQVLKQNQNCIGNLSRVISCQDFFD